MAKYRVKLESIGVHVYEVDVENIDEVYIQFVDNDTSDWVLVDSYPEDDTDVRSVELIEDE